MDIELELVSGSPAKLTLPEAGDFDSFYVFSMEYSGNVQFWKLLERLMAAAGRPLYNIHKALHEQGLNASQLRPSSRQQLLSLRGYGFGILFDVDPKSRDMSVSERHKLLFLRDPRNMLVAWYRHRMKQAEAAPGSGVGGPVSAAVNPAPSPFTEFLESPAVEGVAGRYRRLAEMYRRGRNVSLLRYEHASSGWHQLAADIVAALNLPIDSSIAASIAADAPPIGDSLPEHDRPPYPALPNATCVLDWKEIAEMQARFADVLTAFGYAPCDASHVRPRAVPKRSPSADAATGPPGSQVQVRSPAPAVAVKPRERPIPGRLGAIWEIDPVLMGRLKANGSAEMKVLGRRVIMNVDATGCRPVIGQPATGEKTLAAFGCSFTYGIAIAAEETFCSVLQGMFPAWRVENHGVPAYSQSRNLIQLERETQWNKPDLVTFCWIPNHLERNVADINWIKSISETSLRATREVPEQRMPRAVLDVNGVLQMRSVRVPRREFLEIDFSDYATDPYHAMQVCFRLFERANSIVTGYGGHFFVTTLQGQLSDALAGRLADAGIPVVDASLTGNEYLCLPDDGHPNALANRLYAERIRDYLLKYAGQQPA
ncbi:MAG: hypothetical protein ACLPWF_33250 [Bryobacteraceae bacterium]